MEGVKEKKKEKNLTIAPGDIRRRVPTYAKSQTLPENRNSRSRRKGADWNTEKKCPLKNAFTSERFPVYRTPKNPDKSVRWAGDDVEPSGARDGRKGKEKRNDYRDVKRGLSIAADVLFMFPL
ncbi:hypothetical protein GWI33_013005 [Rhynchophorus ferrugineus]|uniref:Uncharacterized protein n=1 Tax=Rhynchophorus ferrugineus TaxID=354439 RepID=A0A834I825_RHYFE|nr:hypothetical protein GWI33_013005 [Rhynchophorus ferrugineus]